jgi:enterochelin esterase-like enzyme
MIGLIYLTIPGCSGNRQARMSSTGSEPLPESQIIDLSVESVYMERKMPVRIYLPKGYGGGKKYPVWYGLHGYSSDETMWTDVGITQIADELIEGNEFQPMIMVFPFVKDDALKEFNKQLKEYGKLGERYIDQYITKELVTYIDSNYATITASKGRYIGGFSMGGMMALRIAFHHPDLFSKVGGYSAAVTSSNFSGTQLEKWLFPDENTDEISDVTKYARKNGLHKLQIYLDWGNENDPFSEGLQSLCDALQKRKIKVKSKVNDSGHNLIPDNFPDYLKFYNAE